MKTFLQGKLVKLQIPQDSEELGRSKTIVCHGKSTKFFANLYNTLVKLRQIRPDIY